MNFYRKQMRVALRNCGYIDPENIMEYIARDGYKALATSLTRDSLDVLADIKASGLRGRGGAGFPTGVKWEIARKFDAPDKYVVCNADEGDPGAFMDRSIMEGDPNSVIEAMMICGYCINAHHGLIYIRAEYPLAVHRLQVAISQAREYGLLGQNILGRWPFPRPANMACWARISWVRALISISRSAMAPAPSSVEKKRP